MTFEQWWDTVAKTPAPDTYKNFEESCRQAWAAGVADERQRCKQAIRDAKDKSGVNDDGQAWLSRATRSDFIAAIDAV